MEKSTLVSQMTGEKIKFAFDFGNVTQDHKDAVNEVIAILKQREGVPLETIIAEIKTKFKIEEIPMMDETKTVWWSLTKDYNIGANIQGYRDSVDENGNPIRIPHICFTADLDYLDKMANELSMKITELAKRG